MVVLFVIRKMAGLDGIDIFIAILRALTERRV